ncbi:MAG: hypothetical protein GY851_20995 [bacterium]|nr:hypothetical protein [bacterium]
MVWTVKADEAGPYELTVRASGPGTDAFVSQVVEFDRLVSPQQADYVPTPRPIETDRTVCAYYFPGWNSYAKWECIRTVAPVRKPMLGYYDESNVECVDWQIKWARENGISCFLVDWYWVEGGEHLKHWFESYRTARYRDLLQVAIMWANHNPAGTHSMEDWKAVSKEWIDNYFGLPGYLQIDGKPAVFIWNPQGIRNDLGGVDAAAEAYAFSQEAARAAGYEGVTFVAMGHDFTRAHCEALEREGYEGITSYHEWARSTDVGGMSRRRRFSDVADTVTEAWEEREEASGKLTYYPVVDTGWDSRPWHGQRAMAIEGRTVELFKGMLRDARSFCEEHDQDIVVLGPLNEWGEGSYIEPNTEFGFGMYQAVRDVFGKGGAYPVNLAPRDVGLGPYDFPVPPSTTSWTFETGTDGWIGSMGVRNLGASDGALRFTTSTHDPALTVSMGQVVADEWTALEIVMSLTGGGKERGTGQVFWSGGGHSISEAASTRFEVTYDGESRIHRVAVGEDPRWRGKIGMIRFDPCDVKGVDVVMEEVRFVR